MKRITFIFFCMVLMTGCSSQFSNKNVTGQQFPDVVGQSLEKEEVSIPNDFQDEFTLLLVGYKQDSQFDIDRWLIGLDMTETKVGVYEIPTIQGMFPRMFSTVIDNGMRKGIPKALWRNVITVYKQGELIQSFTGNEKPNNARVILINKKGTILYFYDEGFSVDALNSLRDELSQ
ncbi:MAG: hypothetical protein P8I03_02585 [Thalassotalea sp.]|nr:hypothetical protein [Thalassotalea sp.]